VNLMKVEPFVVRTGSVGRALRPSVAYPYRREFGQPHEQRRFERIWKGTARSTAVDSCLANAHLPESPACRPFAS
jgi:hypothetical protein